MAMDRKTSLLLIPLIIAIIAIIGLVAAIVYMNSDIEKLMQEMDQYKRDADRAEEGRAQEQVQRANLAKFVTGNPEVDSSALRSQYLVRRAVNQHLERFLEDRPRREYATLTALYNDVFTDRIRALEKALKADQDAKSWHEQVRAQTEANRKMKERLEVQISELRENVREIEAEKSAAEQRHKAEISRLLAQIEQLRTEKEESDKKHNMEVAALRSEIAEKKRRIKDILKKPPKTLMWCDPDGEILLADNRHGYCWVNLNRRHGIQVGNIFEVFRYIKGGRRKRKGRIEIKKVEDLLSKAAIIETVDPEDDPVVKGDHIISPLFDKEETKEFVFAGELINPIYSKADVKRMIEEMGGKVVSEVSVETDFLVLGKGAEDTEEYTKALDLRIVIMLEKELFKYLGK